MNDSNIQTNSIKAWFLAARPKTLSGAAVPVMTGCVLAYNNTGWQQFQLLPAVLCLLFAWMMQIDSNLINDFFDFKKGNDIKELRLGPKRACSEGWITLPAMKVGIVITTIIACCIGLPLIFFGGWNMIIIGVLCVLFAFLYTTKLSYLGLGDLLVLVFFGIVPVCLTYYVIMPEEKQCINGYILLAGIACGLVIDTLLLVNNYRDRDNDLHDGKITLVVRIGEKAAEILYLTVGVVAVLIMIFVELSVITSNLSNSLTPGSVCIIILPLLLYLCLHISVWKTMVKINKGKELNHVLGLTARNMFVFGLMVIIGLVLA
nr:1,4-dihydroxy-2-naphthoate octaprenyltransferase [Prevotella sp.]